MNKMVILVLSSLLLNLTSKAQKTVSLKEAIEYSLKNHGSNAVYKNETLKAKYRAREALADYLPQVSGSFSFDDNLKLQTTVLPGALLGQDEDIQVQFGNKYNSNAVIQLDQTIYDQALIYGIKAGVSAKKIAELNEAKNKEDLIYNTASAYAQILILIEHQKIILANEKQYQELYNITNIRLQKGVARKVDLDKVVVQLNSIRLQEKQVLTNIDVAYSSLKNAMGLPLDTKLQITQNFDYDKYLQLSRDTLHVQDLIEYQLEEQNIALQQIDLKIKRSAYLPKLSAYGRNGEQAFGNEVNAAFNDWKNYAAVGLKLSVPIFSGSRKYAQVQQSLLELENTKQNLNLNANHLQMQFQNAYRQLQDNVTTLTSNKSNMVLAETIFQTSKFEYNKGVSSMSDLLNADFSYKQSQSDYVSALLNLVGNRLVYERAKGSLASFIN